MLTATFIQLVIFIRDELGGSGGKLKLTLYPNTV